MSPGPFSREKKRRTKMEWYGIRKVEKEKKKERR